MIEPIRIRVYGVPCPFPKKIMGVVNGKPRMVDRDYRTRKNPITGETEKYDRGYMRRWMDHIVRTTLIYMKKNNVPRYPAKTALALGCIFYIKKAPSNKQWIPVQKPDMDNFVYAVWNALGNTRTRTRPGKYPDGVLYYDDSQIKWRLPEGEVWATKKEPPGVLISVCDALEIREEIESLSNTGELRLV